jgi:hypothetical protein
MTRIIMYRPVVYRLSFFLSLLFAVISSLAFFRIIFENISNLHSAVYSITLGCLSLALFAWGILTLRIPFARATESGDYVFMLGIANFKRIPFSRVASLNSSRFLLRICAADESTLISVPLFAVEYESVKSLLTSHSDLTIVNTNNDHRDS